MLPTFGAYLKTLRKQRGLTLKRVEKEAKVSNAYISLLERGLRPAPHPDILQRLARVYQRPVRELMVEAGYLPQDVMMERKKQVEQAFAHVKSDPDYSYGTRIKDAELSLDAKRFIIEMYEKSTGRKLLKESDLGC